MFFLIEILGLILKLKAITIILILLTNLIGLYVVGIYTGVRRMHDAGKSGWFVLVPFYNLVLACTDSEVGENKWRPNPKGIGN
ncbi:MAG: DUF805 domain-containing protein [Leadbetterella sp.]